MRERNKEQYVSILETGSKVCCYIKVGQGGDTSASSHNEIIRTYLPR